MVLRSRAGRMARLTAPLLVLAALAACTGDSGKEEIARQREASRQVARENRDVATREIADEAALPARYRGLEVAAVEDVAAAIETIPAAARRIRTAKAIAGLDVLLVPEPVVIGPSARGDLQLDNTAPLETIRNAIEGSALAHTRVRSRGVIIADIVAARLEDDRLTIYVEPPG